MKNRKFKKTFSHKKLEMKELGNYLAKLLDGLPSLTENELCCKSHISWRTYHALVSGVEKALDVYFRLMRVMMKYLPREEWAKVLEQCCLCCAADIERHYTFSWVPKSS